MTPYQDLVIKEGRFIGKFEEMYKSFDDPWNQSDESCFNDLSNVVASHYINTNRIKNCIEFGCGLGKTMNYIHSLTNIDMLGIDISSTAIKKAKENHPKLSFKVDTVENLINYSQYECFFFSQITWYLLEDNLLDRVFKNMTENLKGRYFIHNLVFYKGQQEYGNNYFTNLNEFISFCPFKLITKTDIDIVSNSTTSTSTIFEI